MINVCITSKQASKQTITKRNHPTITIYNISLLQSVIQRHSMLYRHTMTSRHAINQSIIIYNSNSPAYKQGIAVERLLLYYICICHIVSHHAQLNNESFIQYYIL